MTHLRAAVASLGLLLLQGQDAPFRAYQNYDFVPGQNVLFEDDFRADTDGEFPSHWDLVSGQAVVNKIDGAPALLLTEGNYAVVKPAMKTEQYLTDPFTVEFDYKVKGDGYNPMIKLMDADGGDHLISIAQRIEVAFETALSGSDAIKDDDYHDRWHHAALAYRAGQLKGYINSTRSLVVPKSGFVPVSIQFAGIGQPEAPVMIKNVRIAAGGDMNMVAHLTTDGKYVARGIKFDFNSATLKAESMGEINGIVAAMKQNAALKFEIGGHTDSDGDAAYNLALSQQRADAVKAVMVGLGIDAARLTTKGYGKTKPMADNATPEGKANNRRVEFVKI